jgi:hypothetical protein
MSMGDWIVVETLCRCGHPGSDHEGGDCAYGWTDEPDELDEDACACVGFVPWTDVVRPPSVSREAVERFRAALG